MDHLLEQLGYALYLRMERMDPSGTDIRGWSDLEDCERQFLISCVDEILSLLTVQELSNYHMVDGSSDLAKDLDRRYYKTIASDITISQP